MSHSPLAAEASRDNLRRYQQGWSALNRLLRENKSFSGREANTAFLNTGQQRFADVSFPLGWGFLDDARAISATDWDGDGDLDHVVTNRTAPRFRILRNTLTSKNHWLSLKLQGTEKATNRDAIGARVQIDLADSPPLVRLVTAGSSFLSQNSKRLHFGLGPNPKIKSVTITWPNGGSQALSGPPALNRHFLVKQGSGWENSDFLTQKLTLATAEQPTLPPDPKVRLIPPAGLPFPVRTTSLYRGSKPLLPEAAEPVLVTLWQPGCPHCAAHFERFHQQIAGLSMVAFSQEDPEDETHPSYHFIQVESADFKALELFSQSFFDLWQPLAVPTSFLLDANREVIAFYRGEVTSTTVQSDLALVKATPLQRKNANLPFAGTWLEESYQPDIRRVAHHFSESNLGGQAIDFLFSATSTKAFSQLPKREQADVFLTLGRRLGLAGFSQEAKEVLEKAYQRFPNDLRTIQLLLTAQQETFDFTAAQKILAEGKKTFPKASELQFAGLALDAQRKKVAKVLAQLKEKAESEEATSPDRFRYAAILIRQGDLASITRGTDLLRETLQKDRQFLQAAFLLSQTLASPPLASPQHLAEANALAQVLQRFRPKDANVFYLKSLIALAQGQSSVARQHFLKSVRLLGDPTKEVPKNFQILDRKIRLKGPSP